MNEMDEFEFEAKSQPEEAFHIEVDLYDTGDHNSLLVVPCNDTYIVVSGDEHLCTLEKTCDEPECWAQTDGLVDEELVERLGLAISSYISSL